jgi:hypothetical protein
MALLLLVQIKFLPEPHIIFNALENTVEYMPAQLRFIFEESDQFTTFVRKYP